MTKSVPCPPASFLQFLHLTAALPEEPRSDEAIAHILEHEGTFSILQTLLPALEVCEHEKSPTPLDPRLRAILWERCALHFLATASTPPPPPTDWCLPVPTETHRQIPSTLREFLRAPDQKILRLRMRKELRQKIHETIDSFRLDLDHVTERKGSPYTLVCTKRLDYYVRDSRAYHKNYDGLRRLLTLPAPVEANQVPALQAALTAGTHWQPLPLDQLLLPTS